MHTQLDCRGPLGVESRFFEILCLELVGIIRALCAEDCTPLVFLPHRATVLHL